MNSAEFMDTLKKKYGIKTDLRLGQILEISHPRIAMYRTSKREFDEDTCKLVAIELDEPLEYVMAEIQAVRAMRSEQTATWRRLARRAKKSKTAAGSRPRAGFKS